MSYVTGANNFKVGFDGLTFFQERIYLGNNLALNYRLNNGVANQLTRFVNDFKFNNVTQSFAVYAQNQATLGRLTYRAESATTTAPATRPNSSSAGPLPPQPDLVPEDDDWWPAITTSAARRPCLRHLRHRPHLAQVQHRRYMEAVQSGGRYRSNPLFTSIGGARRRAPHGAWTDQNRNLAPDCDLLNPGTQDLRATGGRLLRPLANSSFGQVTNPTQIWDPDVLKGWDVRADDWQVGASVQHEIAPRISAQVGFIRRWFRQLRDHRQPADGGLGFRSLQHHRARRRAAARRRRLRDRGPLSLQHSAGQDRPGTREFVTRASNFGNMTQHWNGVDCERQARIRNGLTLQGGTAPVARYATAATSSVTTEPAQLPRDAPLPDQIKGLATYTIRRVAVQVAGTWQSTPDRRSPPTSWCLRRGAAKRSVAALGERRQRHHQPARPGQMYRVFGSIR
jgi:hypothetical protein